MLNFTLNLPKKAIRAMVIALMLLGTGLTALASQQEMLKVIFKNGQHQSYLLSDRPKVTFDGSTMFIQSPSLQATHKIADVHKFVFEAADPASVPTVDKNECRLTFIDGTNVILEGHHAGTQVVVTDINGRAVKTLTTDSSGNARIDISDLIPGVYIITTGDGKSYKIMKR